MTTKPKKNKVNTQKNKSNSKKDWSFYTIIVCLVILAIPASFFGYQGIRALMDGKKPIIGDRFDNHFDNKIEKTHISTIEEQIKVIPNVESVSSTLITGTLRFAVVTTSDISQESLNAVSTAVYAAVVNELPVGDYFQDTSDSTRYDLELAVHNGLIDDENFILQMVTKNADMQEVTYQYLTTPQSEEWVAEMWKRQEEKDQAIIDKNNQPDEPAEEETENNSEDTEGTE